MSLWQATAESSRQLQSGEIVTKQLDVNRCKLCHITFLVKFTAFVFSEHMLIFIVNIYAFQVR